MGRRMILSPERMTPPVWESEEGGLGTICGSLSGNADDRGTPEEFSSGERIDHWQESDDSVSRW